MRCVDGSQSSAKHSDPPNVISFFVDQKLQRAISLVLTVGSPVRQKGVQLNYAFTKSARAKINAASI
jgi:hypothetical protein